MIDVIEISEKHAMHSQIFMDLVTLYSSHSVRVFLCIFAYNGQADGLRKVLEIFASDTVEAAVRKSAADQLAIMLQGMVIQLKFRSVILIPGKLYE